MRKLEQLIKLQPAYANFPIAMIDGKPVTIRELLDRAKAGDPKALATMRTLHVDPPEEDRELAKEFFKQLRGHVIVTLSRKIYTPEQIVEMIERGDKEAERFIQIYRIIKQKILEATRG